MERGRVNARACAVLLATQLAAPARAAFQTDFHSGRTAALGGTVLAATPEATAVFMNPAALARVKAGEAYFTYIKPYAGLDADGELGIGSMAAALPTKLGVFGAGLGTFMAPGLKQERTVALGFARGIADRIQLGGTARFLHHSHSIAGDPRAERDPVFANGTARSAVALDLGVTGTIFDPFKGAFTVRNMNRPDVGLVDEDRVPLEAEGGLALDLPEKGLLLTGGFDFRDDGTEELSKATPKLGVEKLVSDGRAAFRLGVGFRELSVGAGLRLGRFAFDYGVTLHRQLISGNLGTHRVGIGYRFGDEDLEAPRLKAFREHRRKITQVRSDDSIFSVQ